MGKYALLLVAGFSVAGAKILFTSQETDVKASQGQSEYDADLIAREIARSAYNAAVADANLKGRDVPAALLAVGTKVVSASQTAENACANGVPICYRREGAMQGGTYRVEASITGGNGVDVYARGQYTYTTVESDPNKPAYGQQTRKPKTYEINEMRSVGVLQVARSGKLEIQFVESVAGYCSAIFLRRTLPGVPAALQPTPEMVYAPGHNRNGQVSTTYTTTLEPGTQMNFGIGVDMNCGGGGTRPNSRPDLRKTAAANYLLSRGPDSLATRMATYRFLESDWNHIHWALDAGSLQNGDPQETQWAMVETDPSNAQHWRIAFEDIDTWSPASLQAFKVSGYDGNGFVDLKRTVFTPVTQNGQPTGGYTVSHVNGQDGFHDLRDGGLDMSDQVIMVRITPPTVPATS